MTQLTGTGTGLKLETPPFGGCVACAYGWWMGNNYSFDDVRKGSFLITSVGMMFVLCFLHACYRMIDSPVVSLI